MSEEILNKLAAVLEQRKQESAHDSYVASLYSKGLDSILKKIGEEATETVMAAKEGDIDKIIYETADLWFHTLILLAQQGLHPDQVLLELDRRFGQSGHAEKASRDMTDSQIKRIIDYWYGNPINETTVVGERFDLWFGKSDEADREIKELFSEDVEKLIAGQYQHWLQTPKGRLASIILIDQFCRQIYRGTPKAFEHDSKALKFCLDGIAIGHDLALSRPLRYFYYLPLEHSESIEHQYQCVAAYQSMADECTTEDLKKIYIEAKGYADKHLVIIERFGRFPHRNEILGRVSTAEEIEFLKGPDSSF